MFSSNKPKNCKSNCLPQLLFVCVLGKAKLDSEIEFCKIPDSEET